MYKRRLQYVFNSQNFDRVEDTYLQGIYNSNYRDWQEEAAGYYARLSGLYAQDVYKRQDTPCTTSCASVRRSLAACGRCGSCRARPERTAA